MKKNLLLLTTVTAAAGLALFMALPGAGQDGPPAAGRGAGKGGGRGAGKGGGAPQEAAGPMARTSDNHPDFSGFWNLPDPPASGIERVDAPAGGGGGGARGGGAPGGPPAGAANIAGGAEGGGGGARGGGGGAARGGGAGGGGGAAGLGFGAGRGGWVVDPPDGKIPYTADARAHQQDLLKNHLAEEPELNCYESGVPHSEANRFGAQIIQMPGYLLQLTEFLHAVRVIPIDPNRKHVDAKYHFFQGDPIAHWEGDTLVVDTTNQNNKTWFDLSGNFKTENLHVTEKFIPVDANTIKYEATMHDPTIYTRDWTASWNLTRLRTPPNSDGHPYELMEFGCIEGNQDLQHYPEDAGGKAKQVLGKKQ